jgi:purine-binding chemotaxis protein CheW
MSIQIVVFKLQDEQFAVETSRVQSISDMMEVTKVPKAPKHIKGLINLRGSIIPLIDLNLLLELKNKDNAQENIIILELEDELAGITVDQVDEVLDIEEDLIEKLTEDKKQSYIKGVINFKDRIVTLIDIDKLLLN